MCRDEVIYFIVLDGSVLWESEVVSKGKPAVSELLH